MSLKFKGSDENTSKGFRGKNNSQYAAEGLSQSDYTIIRIPKKNGCYRNIYSIKPCVRDQLRSYLPYLESRFHDLEKYPVNHAFVPGRNCVLNAMRHIGYKYTLTLDLVKFFESVKSFHIEGKLKKEIVTNCFIDGSPQQGLPTSPMIANIAFLKCDDEINYALNSLSIDHVYTRYADDLTISFNDIKDLPKVRLIVKQIVENGDFFINEKKTKFQSSLNGRIIITGVAIDKYGVYPTRKHLKKIRAAMHQGNLCSIKGMKEWSKCKLPNKLVNNNG